MGEQFGAAVTARAVGQFHQQFGGDGQRREQGEQKRQGAHGQVFRVEAWRETLAKLAGRVPAA
ncbi:hypothetical protein D3C75_1264340 [compost metagenome]